MLRNKAIIVGASLVVATGLLAGCGASEETSKEPAAQTEEKQDQQADVVTTASIVNDNEAFLKAISKDGTWIVATLNDLTFDEAIVVEGEFRNKGDETKDIYRKLAPYTQDDDRNVTERFTITAPKMTVKSPNFRIQAGIFAGDVYVEAEGFNLKDAKVEGNIYFASEDVKATFTMDEKSSVTGVTEVLADEVSAASIVSEEADFAKAISKDGTWIIATLNDLTFDEELVVEGEFRDKGDETKDLYRKIAPYTQDADRNVTDRFTITAPKMTIKSPNTKLQAGIFVGDVYVEAKGFNLKDAKVDGNVYFASEDVKAAFTMDDKSTVTGVTEVK